VHIVDWLALKNTKVCNWWDTTASVGVQTICHGMLPPSGDALMAAKLAGSRFETDVIT